MVQSRSVFFLGFFLGGFAVNRAIDVVVRINFLSFTVNKGLEITPASYEQILSWMVA